MATIQIRDVPDDVHEVLTRLAQEAGQSLQAYMRQQVVDLAKAPGRKAEALARIRAALLRSGGAGATTEEIVADVQADRR